MTLNGELAHVNGGRGTDTREIDRRTLLRWPSALGGALVLPVLGGTGGSTAAWADSDGAAERLAADEGARRVLAQVRELRFRPLFFPATAFGAVGNGGTDRTAAFRRAIAPCHLAGGEHVVAARRLRNRPDPPAQ